MGERGESKGTLKCEREVRKGGGGGRRRRRSSVEVVISRSVKDRRKRGRRAACSDRPVAEWRAPPLVPRRHCSTRAAPGRTNRTDADRGSRTEQRTACAACRARGAEREAARSDVGVRRRVPRRRRRALLLGRRETKGGGGGRCRGGRVVGKKGRRGGLDRAAVGRRIAAAEERRMAERGGAVERRERVERSVAVERCVAPDSSSAARHGKAASKVASWKIGRAHV